jgi:hypothetical protein
MQPIELEVELDARKRLKLAKVTKHKRWRLEQLDDGVILLTPLQPLAAVLDSLDRTVAPTQPTEDEK